MKRKWYYFAPLAILGMLLFAFLGGQLALHLWNWLMPPLFGLHPLAFWQALGLLALCRILFGHHGWRPGHYGWRDRMKHRCGNMTPEDREKFRQAMRERWD